MEETHSVIADRVTELEAPARARAGTNPYADERRDLAALPAPEGVLRPGSLFPVASVVDVNGVNVTLPGLAAGRPMVVIFYRGAWCPYCNLALRAYEEFLVEPLHERGVALAAVSPQTPDGSMSMQEEQALTFSVLSDSGNHLARGLGILTRPADASLAAQRAAGLDLTVVNADGTPDIPMPTVAIVDAEGVLVWIDVHQDYSTRTEPAAILQALDREVFYAKGDEND
jgi:peroxiredoxin